MTPKAHTTKTKNQCDYIKFRSLCTSKETINWNDKQWEKIFANQVQWLISKTCEELRTQQQSDFKIGKGWKQIFSQRKHIKWLTRCYEKMLKVTNQRNMPQNHNKLSPHTFQNAYHQRTRDGKFWQEGKESELVVYALRGNVGSATMENNTEIPQKLNRST